MTEQLGETSAMTGSLDERIEVLASELELAARWNQSCILLAVYGSEYVRADAELLLKNQLIDQRQGIVHVQVSGEQNNLFEYLQEHSSRGGTVFSIEGLRWGQVDGEDMYDCLNNRRDFFNEFGVRAIFWLTQNEIAELARRAPDFWGRRGRVVEFTEAPTPAQLMQQALDSAWQGTGEYVEQYDDTDAKILLRESLLTTIPAGEETSSTRANLLLTLGLLNWRKGDFEKADEQLNEALRFAEKIQDRWFEAECFNAIALLKSGMDRIDEAIEAYKQAIRLAPGQIFAWNNLGNLCTRIGRNDEALVTFLKAIKCNARDPIAWNGLGNVYHKIGYSEDAIAAYRKSIEFLPSFAHPWNGLGDAYASAGRSEDAVKAYQRAIELNPEFVVPWLRLGELFSRQDRYRDALRAYQRALAIDPRNPGIWNELGLIYSRSNAPKDAANAFLKAIEIDRSFGWAYSNLALIHVRQGEYAESIPLYQRSIELLKEDRDRVISWNRLGNVYRQLNDYDHAIAAYQAADQLDTATPRPLQPALADEPAPSPVTEPAQPLPQDMSQESADVPDPLPAVEKAGDDSTSTPAENAPGGPYDVSNAPSWLFDQAPLTGGTIEQQSGSRLTLPDHPAAEPGTGVNMLTPADLNPVEPSRQKAPANGMEAEGLPLGQNESSNAYAWNEKGNIHFRKGAYGEAIAAYNKAIQLEPAFGWPYSNLALTYFAQGQHAEAILLYQKSLQLLSSDKERAVSWSGLGNAYRAIGDYPNALAAYQKAGEVDPETGGLREGVQTLHLVPGLQNAQVLNDLGEIFLKAGVYNEAANAFGKAISLEPGFGWPYSNLARTLAAQGHYSQAIPLYQKSIELFSDDKDKAVSWNRLGNAYRRLNDYDHAIKAFQEAVALNNEGTDLITRTRFSLLSNCYAG